MKNYFFYIMFLCSLSVSSQNDCWLHVTNSKGLHAFVDKTGNIKIPYGKYKFILSDTLCYFAYVYEYEGGVVAINREDKIIFRPVIIDNLLPDLPSEGLFRIIDNGKIGFANLKGEVTIPPQFEAVKSFKNDIAAYCVGCQMKYDTITEYGYWSDGKWGFINKSGEIAVEACYDDLGFWNNQIVAKRNDTIY